MAPENKKFKTIQVDKLAGTDGSSDILMEGGGNVTSTTATQTLTNKTLTAPSLTTPTITEPTITEPTITDPVQLGMPTTELTATATFVPKKGTEVLELNHATVAIAATIAAPVPGNFLIIPNTSASGTAAHTVTLTAGTFDGTNNIATFNAPNETLVLYAVSATRYVIVENIGSVGLSV
jgi:hypothetical protein